MSEWSPGLRDILEMSEQLLRGSSEAPQGLKIDKSRVEGKKHGPGDPTVP